MIKNKAKHSSEFLVRVVPLTLNFFLGRKKEKNSLYFTYTNDVDKSLNEAANDKIRKYRADYNNNPPNAVAFMPAITGTNGRLHSDFIRLLFLQSHRGTDRFFVTSGVQSVQGLLSILIG